MSPFPRIRCLRGHGWLAGALAWLAAATVGTCTAATSATPVPGAGLSPTALAASGDGRAVYVACATAPKVLVVDPSERRVVRTIDLDVLPSGLALSPDGRLLAVTSAGPGSGVRLVEATTGAVTGRLRAGHTGLSPFFSPDGGTLWVCNRFDNNVIAIDVASRREVRRIQVIREPVSAAITPDGRYVLVANHLHDGRADADDVAARISVIEVAAGRVVKELRLPTGSGALNDVRISPDGRHAFVTHILARYHLPTTQLERGWMNTNAGTLIDLADLSVVNTVLLDSVDSGAANPWGVAWSADGKALFVAHAGSHEVSIIDFPALLAKLARVPATAPTGAAAELVGASRERADVPNDLSFLVGLRQRVRLPAADRGPRALGVAGGRLVVANYFSDSLSLVDPGAKAPGVESVGLGPRVEPSLARRGEELFHDAGLCFQTWQSCATCHPGDARVDALNWDLLNDDLGNPKNNKSLLLSHRTPPAMSLGVRDTAETAVRAGIRHILFTVQPEEVGVAMDEYLKELRPVPSPYLRKGRLSAAAKRGSRIFGRAGVGCADCHPAGLFTNLSRYDVGTRGAQDPEGAEFDTPTLVEVWRTAPYLHDGSVTTLQELFTTRNAGDRHGQTSQLSPSELADLIEYVLSL